MKERRPFSNPIRGKLDLSIGFEIHEDERVALCIKKTEILEFEIDRLDQLVGAEAFVELARVDENSSTWLNAPPSPGFTALVFTATHRFAVRALAPSPQGKRSGHLPVRRAGVNPRQ